MSGLASRVDSEKNEAKNLDVMTAFQIAESSAGPRRMWRIACG
jgi:hypothetical protein